MRREFHYSPGTMKISRRAGITTAFVMLGCCAALLLHAEESLKSVEEEEKQVEDSKNAQQSQIEDLRDEMKKLRVQFAESELKVAMLEQRIEKARLEAERSPGGIDVNPSWRPFRFDGEIYYSIPLGHSR